MCIDASLRTYVRASMFVTVCLYICASHACVCVFARVGMCAYVRAYVFVCECTCRGSTGYISQVAKMLTLQC